MDYLYALIIGLAAAAGAVTGPGMLNMNVVRTSLRCGRKEALLFAAGIVTIFTAQAAIGTIGANYLKVNDEIIDILKKAAPFVFVALAVFFFYRGWKKHHGEDEEEAEDEDENNDSKFYGQGVSLALMNFLAIPYFFALQSWAQRSEWLSSKVSAKVVFVLAAGAGAFGIFAGYAFLAPWVKENVRPLTRNLNYVLCGLFVILASVQTYRLLS